MRASLEYDVIQNTAFAATAIHAAVLQARVARNEPAGVALPLLMLVLPISWHEPSRKAIASKVFAGSFYKAISDDRTIAAGLQQRMQAMRSQSFRAINLAASAGLILASTSADQSGTRILLLRKTEALSPQDEGMKEVLATAKRVGHWLATVRPSTLCSVLQVRF